MVVTAQDICNAVEKLEFTNKPICIHSSLNSFGHVAGGADTIIQSFLQKGCTIVVPTFSDNYSVSPPIDKKMIQNGCGDYSWLNETIEKGKENIYKPYHNEIDKDMGVIPWTILMDNRRIRGNHPLNSFSAIGPYATKIICDQCPTDVYAPLKSLIELDGYVVLMGVNLDRLTLLHLAEQIAGRNMFRRWAKGLNGHTIDVEVGGCSEGFRKFQPLLQSNMEEIVVGKSTWEIFKAKTVVELAVNAIQRDPSLTHCGDNQCDRCNDAIKGGPIFDSSNESG